MPNDSTLPYRTQYDDASPRNQGPHEDLGHASLPVVGEVTGEVRLDRSFHVTVDRHAASLRPAGGLVLRAESLPEIDVRGVHVDLVDGLVRTEADALGPFFDRVLTVVLCSALRQAVGWKPGISASESLTRRIPRGRKRFPRTSVALAPETRIELDVGGEGVTLTLTLPAVLRFLGIPVKITALRYEFADAKVTTETRGVGPVRRGVLRLLAWGATRWLRPRLPAAMTRPGYDLFADVQRRDHVKALVAGLRGQDHDEKKDTGVDRPGHELARVGSGDKAGMLGLFSASKAAIVAALASVRITADDVPANTRVLLHLPLGPLSRLALCTDRGGEVVFVKYRGGARIEAPLGMYLFADQFPELAELRLTRIDIGLARKNEVDLDIQTEPPLGPFAKALLRHALDTQARPRMPTERMRAAGVWDDGPDHLLWRQELGGDRRFTVRTKGQAEVRVRHTDEGLIVEAPAGLEAVFDGVPVPTATMQRVMYRWDDGTIEVDGGDKEFGAFGQTVAASLMRVRGAPHLPPKLGFHAEPQPEFDPAQLEKFSAVIAGIPLPLIGKFELRMDPADILESELGPTHAQVRSGRGLLLVAAELRLALHIRSARYDLATKKLDIDASPAPGPYMTALAGMCIEAFLVPLLQKVLPKPTEGATPPRWPLYEGSGVTVSLPPGAALTARRTPDMLEFGGTAPIEVDGHGGIVADFTVDKLRWIAADDRIVVDSTPLAGPLMVGLVRRALDRVVPDFVARAVAGRLALPAPNKQEPLAAPTMPALFETEVAQVGPISLHVDAHHGMTLTMRHEKAELRFGAGAVVHAAKLGVQLIVHKVEVTFLPFTLDVESEPISGELEDHLLAQVARTLLAPAMRMLWPADRAPQFGRDVLLVLGADASWGPLELCVPPGGQVEAHLDHERVTLRSESGVFVAGIDWLPNVGVHALSVRFEDGAVDLEVGEVAERFYHEAAPVSATSLKIAERMIAVWLSPHTPGWAQRLGMRVLPPPPALPVDAGRITVWESQLPGGLAKLEVRMDPLDLIEVRASRTEISFVSERGLHVDLDNLQLRLDVRQGRYHMLSGELQLPGMGQFENAVAEGLLRKALATVDPTAAPADDISLIDILERFPVDDDGNRILFGDKVVRVLLDPKSEFVLHIGTEGLAMTVDPPLKIDGPAVLNFVFGGLRYDFKDGEFKLDFKHDGVISRMLSGLFQKEGEGVLNSLRPVLPAPMRKPGYSLATDPNPSATLASLVRTVSRGRYASPAEAAPVAQPGE